MYVVTSSLTVGLLRGQLDCLREMGFEVILVSAAGEELKKAERDGVRTMEVAMAREIAPWRDLRSLWMLLKLMRKLRPMIVNFSTPKAALLGGIAAWLTDVPCRIYTLRGLRCETTAGMKRRALMATERIACACAHRVICVSESLRQKAIELGVVDANLTVVLGGGSSNGVEVKRFAPTGEAQRRGEEIRSELGIPLDAPVVGFVGRLTKDKGIAELVDAFLALRSEFPELRLLLVGEPEAGDPLPAQTRKLLESMPGIVRTGFLGDPAGHYQAMDVLALPTYREGFPTVALEASAAGKPVIMARATGAVDAVIDGVTGILVPVGDSHALASALELVIRDRNLAAAFASAGRERVLREFQQETVWDALAEEYLQLLQVKGLTVPTAVNRNEAKPGLKAAATVPR
jgi:glycosyltransferase involved in cell wall biosynthesis